LKAEALWIKAGADPRRAGQFVRVNEDKQ